MRADNKKTAVILFCRETVIKVRRIEIRFLRIYKDINGIKFKNRA